MLFDMIFKQLKTTEYIPSTIDISTESLFDNVLSNSKSIFGGIFETDFKLSSKWPITKHFIGFKVDKNNTDYINLGYIVSEFELFLKERGFACEYSTKALRYEYDLVFYLGKPSKPDIVQLEKKPDILDILPTLIPILKKKTTVLVSRTGETIIVSTGKKPLNPNKKQSLLSLFSLGAAIKYIELMLKSSGHEIAEITYKCDSTESAIITIK